MVSRPLTRFSHLLNSLFYSHLGYVKSPVYSSSKQLYDLVYSTSLLFFSKSNLCISRYSTGLVIPRLPLSAKKTSWSTACQRCRATAVHAWHGRSSRIPQLLIWWDTTSMYPHMEQPSNHNTGHWSPSTRFLPTMVGFKPFLRLPQLL